jgi:beta-galactosidase
VKVVDKEGRVVPYADNLINFSLEGEGDIVGVDNGSQTSHEPFKANYRKAFHGLCLAVVQAKEKVDALKLKASSEGLESAVVTVKIK